MLNGSNISNLDGVTYDTLRDWIYQDMQRFQGVVETTWPDIVPYKKAGGKILMFLVESDWSILTASLVRYWESVRKITKPGQGYNESAVAQNEFVRSFLVPGATHCASNSAEPNGSFPETNLAVMIDWVENGVVPETLNSTVVQGENKGQNIQICGRPLRPFWTNNGGNPICEYDQKSLDYWN